MQNIPITPNLRYLPNDLSFNGNSSRWYNSGSDVGNYISIRNNYQLSLQQSTPGNGVNKIFTVLTGTTIPSITITNSDINVYTLFTVARYNDNGNGVNNRMIFSGTIFSNWYSGFNNNHSGVANHNSSTSLTQSSNNASNLNTSNPWVLSTDYAYSYRCNGVSQVTNLMTGITYLPSFGINVNPNSNSQFQIADIIIYKSQLTLSQIVQVENYLFNLYGFNGYYSNGYNIYSLCMPILSNTLDYAPITNYQLFGKDWNACFQLAITAPILRDDIENFKSNNNKIFINFQQVDIPVFKCQYFSPTADMSNVSILIEGIHLEYVKNCYIIFGDSSIKTMTINLARFSNYIIVSCSIIGFTYNTQTYYSLYLFDANNQYYDNSYNGSFYTSYTPPTFNNPNTTSLTVTSFTVSMNTTKYNGTITYSITGGTGQINSSGVATGLSPDTSYTVTATYSIVSGGTATTSTNIKTLTYASGTYTHTFINSHECYVFTGSGTFNYPQLFNVILCGAGGNGGTSNGTTGGGGGGGGEV